jgi:hypothetical protein
MYNPDINLDIFVENPLEYGFNPDTTRFIMAITIVLFLALGSFSMMP